MLNTILLVDRDPDQLPDGIPTSLIECGIELARRTDATLHVLHCGSLLAPGSSRRADSRHCRPFGSETHAEGLTQQTRRHDAEAFIWFGYDWQTIAATADAAADAAGITVVRSYYPLVDWSRTETIGCYVGQELVDLVCTAAVDRRGFESYRGPTFPDRLRTRLDVPVLTIPEGGVRRSGGAGSRYERLLVTNTGLQFDRQLIEQAFDIASYTDATIHVLYIGLTGGYSHQTLGLIDRNQPQSTQTDAAYEQFIHDAYRSRGANAIQPVRQTAQELGADIVEEFRLGEHSVTEPLLAYAKTAEIDLIMLATHDRPGISQYVGESLTSRAVGQHGIAVLATNRTPPA